MKSKTMVADVNSKLKMKREMFHVKHSFLKEGSALRIVGGYRSLEVPSWMGSSGETV
jgi:hypothetical protein